MGDTPKEGTEEWFAWRNRACEHGYQRRKCPVCESIATEAENDSLRAALKELVFISEYMNHIEWRVRSDNERFDPPMRWDKAIAKAKEVIGNGTP